MTTMPKVNEDCKGLGGWPFHDKHPVHPRNIRRAVPRSSARNIATLSAALLPILFNFHTQNNCGTNINENVLIQQWSNRN